MSDDLIVLRDCDGWEDENALCIPIELPSQHEWNEEEVIPVNGANDPSTDLDALHQTQYVPNSNYFFPTSPFYGGLPIHVAFENGDFGYQGWEQWPHPYLDGNSQGQRVGGYSPCDDWYIKSWCVRAFIFRCIYHDGHRVHFEKDLSPIVLNYVSKERMNDRGPRVPAEYPYIHRAWDFWTDDGSGNYWCVDNSGKPITFKFHTGEMLTEYGNDIIFQIIDRRTNKGEWIKNCVPAYTPFDLCVVGQSFRRMRRKCIDCRCYESDDDHESMSSWSTDSTSSSTSSSSSESSLSSESESTMSSSSESSIMPRAFRALARAMDSSSTMSSLSSSSESTISYTSNSSSSESSQSPQSWSSQSWQSESSFSDDDYSYDTDGHCYCQGELVNDWIDKGPWAPYETMPANHHLQFVFSLCNKGPSEKALDA